jgi:hypothetical protein
LHSGKRIGLEIALEEQAEELGDPVVDEAVRRETIRIVRAELGSAQAEPIIEQLLRGEMTDEQSRQLVDILKEQGGGHRRR